MPELPEAETIVRGLRPALVGSTIGRIEILHEDVLRESKRRFGAKVRGRRIEAVARRGKNVLLRLDGEWVLAVNLGMTGRLLPFDGRPPPSTRPTHPAVRFRLTSGALLVFDDTRRFGTVECLSERDWSERSRRMGPEPLDPQFSPRDLHRLLSASRAPLRSWLLDQRRIAGVGNIYANEALYLAGLHPERRARTVAPSEAAALHGAIRRVLSQAIEAGGTTLRDYRNAAGEEGEYGRELLAYGRDGEPCGVCGTEIRRLVFGGRSAFYCPGCQPNEASAEP